MAHFFMPPSPQVVQTFRIPLGETWYLALWGIDRTTGDLKPVVDKKQIAAAFVPPFPPQGGVLKFAVQALQLGTARLEGQNSNGQPWAVANIVVVQPAAPKAMVAGGPDQEVLEPGLDYRVYPNYIDKVKGAHFDVDSDKFTVDHEDGSTVELPYRQILGDVRTSKSRASGPAGSVTVGGLVGYLRDRKTQKIHPLQYNETTTPNLAAMVLETEEVIQNSKNLFEISKALLEIVAVYAQVNMASGGMRPKWKTVTAKGPAGRPKLAPNIVQGEPPTVKIGTYGQAGNLIARVEVGAGGKVVYRVKSIILQGEGSAAEIATARLAHREMLARAALQAQKAGQKTFMLRGVQANQNFRAHADRLAQAVGEPGSGKSLGGLPGMHSDYEVVLNVGKVLASP